MKYTLKSLTANLFFSYISYAVFLTLSIDSVILCTGVHNNYEVYILALKCNILYLMLWGLSSICQIVKLQPLLSFVFTGLDYVY